MKYNILFFCFFCLQLAAQNQMQKPNYNGIEISIPADYTVNAQNEIGNEHYSVYWKEVPQILYENNVHKQMVKQIEDDLHGRFLSAIPFTSQGAALTGKMYQLKNKEGIRYRIVASGLVNNKPVILNLGFAKLPRQNSDLDTFMQQFIRFEK